MSTAVSFLCTWSVTPAGQATFDANLRNRLVCNPTASAGSIQVTASFLLSSGYRASVPVTIQVQETSWVQIRVTGDKFQGHDGYWFEVLSGGPAGLVTSGNATWDFDHDGQFGDMVGTNIWCGTEYYGLGGKTTLIGCHCVFPNGDINEVYFFHTPSKESALVCAPVVDLTESSLLGADGEHYVFAGDKTTQGLVVLTHGLFNSGKEQWLLDLTNAMNSNLGETRPNLCIYDWGAMADPTFYSTGGRRAGANQNPVLQADDFITIKPYGKAQGMVLADAIEDQRKAGLVDKSKPVHLIGHSAGGFVMGECGQLLRKMGYANVQVTMLDTPLPYGSHATGRGSGYRVERYISSCLAGSSPDDLGGFGNRVNDWEKPDHDSIQYTAGAIGAFLPRQPTRWYYLIPPGDYYYRAVHTPPTEMDVTDAHSYAHEWYEGSIGNAGTEDGFKHSIAKGFTGTFPTSSDGVPALAGALALSSESAPGIMGALPDIALTNWVLTGTVSRVGEIYTFTDTNDAAIYQDTVLPVGALTLKLRYRFASAGDGDFLSVHWGQKPVLYIGLDLPISRDQALDTEVPLAQYAGQTNRLILLLTARGATNAVAVVDSLALTEVDDPDNDGLVTTQEVAQGTSPLLADTDGDGLSDADEVNTYHTDPLLADSDGDGAADGVEVWAGTNPTNATSVFTMASARPVTNGVELTWTSQTGLTYRVQRRLDILSPDFDTVASGLTGQVATTSYTDTTAQNLTKAVYWVQTEQSQ